MDSEGIRKEFEEYVQFCRDAVDSLGDNPTLQGPILGVTDSLKKELAGEGRIKSTNVRDVDVMMAQRQKLIDIKVNHTNRVVSDILKVAKKIGMPVDYERVVEVVARLHDIGRFEYATWTKDLAYGEEYADQEAERKIYEGSSKFSELASPLEINDPKTGELRPVKYHSEAGYSILMKSGRLTTFDPSKKLSKLIATAVLHHQDGVLTGEFNPQVSRIDDKILNTKLEDLLKETEGFNEAEKQIYAILTQLIRDVDCIDILYQHLTGEFPVIKTEAAFNKNLIKNEKDATGKLQKVVAERRSLSDFAKQWGFTPEYVATYNFPSDTKADALAKAEAADTLKLPLYQNGKWLIDPTKLQMPEDLKERYFNLERIDLQEINKRYAWNPIVGMWWRLLKFLGDLNLTSNLEVIEENELLDKIYEQYPDEVKPFVKEAFDFAKEYLLKGRGSDIYAKQVLK